MAEAAPVAVTTSNPVLVSHRAALFCVELSAQATRATRRLSVAPIDRLVGSAPNVGIAGSATVRLELEGVFGRGHWELSRCRLRILESEGQRGNLDGQAVRRILDRRPHRAVRPQQALWPELLLGPDLAARPEPRVRPDLAGGPDDRLVISRRAGPDHRARPQGHPRGRLVAPHDRLALDPPTPPPH